jgi:hypothetical protein
LNATTVVITSYAATNDEQEPDYLFANYMRVNGRGFVSHKCECGEHLWALPWLNEMDAWVRHLRSPLRAMFEAKGFAPKELQLSPHVVIASVEDADLLKLRRWRVFPTRGGCRAKYQLQSGPRGLPLHRMVMVGAKIVRLKNRNGLDVRRCNLFETTKQQLALECRARKAAKRKAQQAAV